MRNLLIVVLISSTASLAPAADSCCCRRAQRPRIARFFSWRSPSRCCVPRPVPCAAEHAAAAKPRAASSKEPELAGSSPQQAVSQGTEWVSMFDGQQLGQWRSTDFGGEGEVTVEAGQIKCDFGQYMTGITHSGKGLPTNHYEIELEAMREDGFDFFCGLTFPVDENHASLIVGGWGGSVVGISSIDDMDASENNTTEYMQFKNKQWYKIRVRVVPGRLQAWIDDKKVVDEDVTADRLSTRIEVDRSKPLGVACFDTQAAYRNIRWRPVKAAAEQ